MDKERRTGRWVPGPAFFWVARSAPDANQGLSQFQPRVYTGSDKRVCHFEGGTAPVSRTADRLAPTEKSAVGHGQARCGARFRRPRARGRVPPIRPFRIRDTDSRNPVCKWCAPWLEAHGAPHRELSFRGSAALHLRLPRAQGATEKSTVGMPVAGFGAPALALSGRVATARVVRAAASGHAVAEIGFLGPATRVASRECGAAGPRNDTSVFIRRVRAPPNDSGSHDSLPVHTESSHLV
jgi:hypothetical protein